MPENHGRKQPHPTLMEMTAQKAAMLFRLVEELAVPVGYERSFKMLNTKLLANRFLLGINTKDASERQLIEICQQIHMPNVGLEAVQKNLEQANVLFLGFEDNEPGCFYKVYLEFWDKLLNDMQRRANPRQPAVLHLGFKWDAFDNDRFLVSEYVCYPLLSVQQILCRLSDLYQLCGDSASARAAEEIISFAASKNSAASFVYLEVCEKGTQRRSFDINVYKANCRVREILPFLSRLREHLSISEERFQRLVQIVGDQPLGHLSGGVNREGGEFLTVYYEA